MKNPTRPWLAFLLCLALTGCGQLKDKFGRQKGYTQLTVNTPVSCPSGNCSLTWPNVAGQMMVYVVGMNGTQFSTTIPMNLGGGTTGSANVSVPNGQYTFYAVGWEGTGSNPFQGQAGCGSVTSPVTLTGGSQSVNLTVTTSGCGFGSGNIFSDNGSNFIASGPNFGQMQIFACNGLSGASCAAPSTTYYTAQVRIRLEGYVRNGGGISYAPGFGINGGCYTLATGSYTTSERIPVGSSTAGQTNFLAVTLEFYTGGTCTGTPNATVHLPYGFANLTSDLPIALGGSGGLVNVYVNLGS